MMHFRWYRDKDNYLSHFDFTKECFQFSWPACEAVGVEESNIIPDSSRMTASTMFNMVLDRPTTGKMDRGVVKVGPQRLQLTVHTIFRLIWVKCDMSVLWRLKGVEDILTGLPVTKYIFQQMEWFGKLTWKITLIKWANSKLSNFYIPVGSVSAILR